jgi:hypothetical protein
MNDQLSAHKTKHCRVCGEPAAETICRPCQAKIHREAARSKQQIEREVRTDTGRK